MKSEVAMETEHDVRRTTKEILFFNALRGVSRVYPSGTRIDVTPFSENGRRTVMLLGEPLGEQTASITEADLEGFTEPSD
jgi:hypothetical protein